MLEQRRYVSIEFREEDLRERSEELSIILDVSNFLSSSTESNTVLDGALAKVMEHFRFAAGRMYLLDEGKKILCLAAHRGIDPGGLEQMSLDEGFSGKAARTRSFIAQYVTELEDRDRAAVLSARGLVIIICVPLIVAGKVIGVMNLAANTVIQLTQRTVDLLIVLGSEISVAVNNARLYQDVVRKAREINKKTDMIEFFTYSISHDLKSPAVAVYGISKILCRRYRDVLDARGREYCDNILSSAAQIVALVDSVNAFIQAKEAPIVPEWVDLRELAEVIRAEFSSVIEERGIRWVVRKDMPQFLVDRLSITRVLRNLVDNALKYGGPALSEIEIGFREDQFFRVLTVGDDGVGIVEDRLAGIFDRYVRLSGPRRAAEGSGLGLAIVREVAERHGGHCWAERRSGGGVVFCVALPRSPEDSREGCRASRPGVSGIRSNGSTF